MATIEEIQRDNVWTLIPKDMIERAKTDPAEAQKLLDCVSDQAQEGASAYWLRVGRGK